MSSETEKWLADWGNEDRYTADDIHRHFDDVGFDAWLDIGAEAARIWEIMFEETIEMDSPIDGILYGVAASASRGAYAKVAKTLNLDVAAFQEFMEERYAEWKQPRVTPGTLTFDDLRNRVLEVQAVSAYEDWDLAQSVITKEGMVVGWRLHPAVAQAAKAWRRYFKALIALGLTPASRSRK